MLSSYTFKQIESVMILLTGLEETTNPFMPTMQYLNVNCIQVIVKATKTLVTYLLMLQEMFLLVAGLKFNYFL